MVSLGLVTLRDERSQVPFRDPRVPLLEERASIDKRTVMTGKVRVVTLPKRPRNLFALFSRGGSGRGHCRIGSNGEWPRASDPH